MVSICMYYIYVYIYFALIINFTFMYICAREKNEMTNESYRQI